MNGQEYKALPSSRDKQEKDQDIIQRTKSSLLNLHDWISSALPFRSLTGKMKKSFPSLVTHVHRDGLCTLWGKGIVFAHLVF